MGISPWTHCITKRGHKNPHVKQDRKAVKDFFLTTSHDINRAIFFPIYKQARAEAYTVDNIKATVKVTGITPRTPELSSVSLQNLLPKAAANLI